MKINKTLPMIIGTALIFTTAAFGAKPEWAGNNKEKTQKQKTVPHGLQKKVERGGELPPGWKKKIQKGQVVDESILSHGKIINSNEYPQIAGSKIYEIEDKIIRVSNATRTILDIFK